MEVSDDENVDEPLETVVSPISSRLLHFIALPSDPDIPLTTEQLNALFPLDNRQLFIGELMQVTLIQNFNSV